MNTIAETNIQTHQTLLDLTQRMVETREYQEALSRCMHSMVETQVVHSPVDHVPSSQATTIAGHVPEQYFQGMPVEERPVLQTGMAIQVED